MKISDPVLKDTWNMLLDLDRQTRYYGRLADRYSKWRRVIRYLLLVGLVVEAAVVYFSYGHPVLLWFLGGAGAFILGFLTIFDASTDYGRLAADLRMASLLCDELSVDAARLWRDIEAGRIEDPQAEDRYNSLVERWIRATQRVELAIHDTDNKIAARETYRVMAEKYGQQG